MNRSTSGIILTLVLLLAGCYGKAPEPAPATEHKALYQDIKAPVDTAQGIEQQVQDDADRQRKEIDRQADQ